MKVRKLIITAGALVALAAPAAQPAGATIPLDGGSRAKSVALKEIKAQLKHKQGKASATAIHLGAYNVWAYAYGGASTKVGKAITSAGKKGPKVVKPVKVTATTPVTNVTPPAGSGVLDHGACLLDNMCTEQELCDIYGLGCMVLEHPVPGEVSAPATELPPADGSSDGSNGSTDATASGASETVPPADLLYEDC